MAQSIMAEANRIEALDLPPAEAVAALQAFAASHGLEKIPHGHLANLGATRKFLSGGG
jgi:hypothetical protein